MQRPVLLFLICLLFSACSGDDRPDNLISENTYIDLLIELQVFKTYQKQHPPDSVNVDSLRSLIFNKYDVTAQQFKESHKYYQQDMEHQRDRIKDAIEKLRKDHTSPRDSTTNDTAEAPAKPRELHHPHQ